MAADPIKAARKAQIDALLLTLPGALQRGSMIWTLIFVSGKMFACISGEGIGLRLPGVTATEFQFSRDNVVPFRPSGIASTREWIQINCMVVAEYAKDLPLSGAALEFVKASRTG